MKIREGSYYRTRYGDVVGPMRLRKDQSWYSSYHQWNEDGGIFSSGAEHGLDLISEVYVSDTPNAFMQIAETPSDDTVVSFNFSEMARQGRNWIAGKIGFWIGGNLHMANYDVRIEGKESNAWPSDVPNPWRDKRGLPAPAPETKTLRDEFAMRLMERDMFAVGFIDEAEQLYRVADAMMEARKK
jgi:hypothetical protein